MILGAYRRISTLAPPVLRVLLRRRVALGKEDAARLGERMGVAARPRPPGRLVWIHGASVGEALSVLALIERLLARLGEAHVLVTTGTLTSARLMADRLPPRAFHQFVPLDAAAWVARFLDHWRPDLGLFVESELWPNLLAGAAARRIPLALINARLSERSFRRWQRWPGAARELLAPFALVLAQSEGDAGRYRAFGAQRVSVAGNLKYAAPPLPADEAKLAELRALIGTRPAWLAASIHPGEDSAVALAHGLLREGVQRIGIGARPDLLTIVVPRHPEKGEAMASGMARFLNVRVARRALGEAPTADVGIYVADTLGELGLFYRLVPAAFVGGSLVPHGGQNPLEAVRLGCAVAFGPHMDNFAPVADALIRAGGARRVENISRLPAEIDRLLTSEDYRKPILAAASAVAAAEAGVIDRVMAALEPLAGRSRDAAA
jgi:3-deoxy-D-manno-octulosonic-acid transferase